VLSLKYLASRSPPDIDRLTVGERANDCPRLIPARVALVMNISGAQGDKIATPSRHAIDADLICLSSHLAVTARADAADGMARRLASDQK
jgi:hypothetical protein